MVSLVIGQCCTGERSEETIHLAMIITLLLQRSLNVGGHLIRWQIVVSVDRAVVGIICAGIIAPCWIPKACIPKIPATENKNETAVITMPPVSVMPLSPVIAKDGILFAFPVFASDNSIAFFKLYRSNVSFRRLREVELLDLCFLRALNRRH